MDLTLNGRFGQGGQFSGGLSAGRTVTDNCYINDNASMTAPVFLERAGACPRRRPSRATSEFCHVAPPWSSGTQLKFLAVYPLPWDIETSAIVQNSPGIPITASYVISNAQIRDLIGRNLAACPATTATCTQTVRTELIPPNTIVRAAPDAGRPARVALCSA